MEGEMWKKELLGSSKDVVPYASANHLDRLSPEMWRDLRMRVAALLDDSVPYSSKKSTAEELCQLFERLQHESTTSDDLKLVRVEPDMKLLCTIDHFDDDTAADRTERQISLKRSADEFNDRLRSKIAEFNEGLSHLGNKIAKLKSRLLLWNERPVLETDSVDIDTCRNVNRNFRRILQKESRYLRDQLYAARETVKRLEKRSLSTSNLQSELCDSNGGLVPSYELKCRPTDFINIESRSSQLWLMEPPMKSLPAAEYQTTTVVELTQPRSALMKRSAPPLGVVAGPDIKSGKFICSFNGATNTSSSSLVEWTPNREGELTQNIEHQTDENQYKTILA